MLRFIVRRSLFGLLVLWIISAAVFVLFFVTPSNVARTIGGRLATPQTLALINHRLGLDRPFLHAFQLAFTHPATGERLELTEPLPPDLEGVLERLRKENS